MVFALCHRLHRVVTGLGLGFIIWGRQLWTGRIRPYQRQPHQPHPAHRAADGTNARRTQSGGEREQGSLLYLLAQPINQLELLLGKFIGLALALIAALALGFGLTALLIALNGGGAQINIYLTLLLLACLLAVASLSIGFLISATVKRGATAVGVALFLWLLLVFFGDLGLMGTALVLELSVDQLFALALMNPLQLFKIAAILDLRNNLEILGPVGIYAFRTYGAQLLPLLIGLLFIWIIIPFTLATLLFKKRGIL